MTIFNKFKNKSQIFLRHLNYSKRRFCSNVTRINRISRLVNNVFKNPKIRHGDVIKDAISQNGIYRFCSNFSDV